MIKKQTLHLSQRTLEEVEARPDSDPDTHDVGWLIREYVDEHILRGNRSNVKVTHVTINYEFEV